MPKDTRRRDARWLPLHEMYLFLFHCDRKIWAYLGAVAAWYPFFPRLSACHLLVVWEKSASASLPPSSLTPCAQDARSLSAYPAFLCRWSSPSVLLRPNFADGTAERRRTNFFAEISPLHCSSSCPRFVRLGHLTSASHLSERTKL